MTMASIKIAAVVFAVFVLDNTLVSANKFIEDSALELYDFMDSEASLTCRCGKSNKPTLQYLNMDTARSLYNIMYTSQGNIHAITQYRPSITSNIPNCGWCQISITSCWDKPYNKLEYHCLERTGTLINDDFNEERFHNERKKFDENDTKKILETTTNDGTTNVTPENDTKMILETTTDDGTTNVTAEDDAKKHVKRSKVSGKTPVTESRKDKKKIVISTTDSGKTTATANKSVQKKMVKTTTDSGKTVVTATKKLIKKNVKEPKAPGKTAVTPKKKLIKKNVKEPKAPGKTAVTPKKILLKQLTKSTPYSGKSGVTGEKYDIKKILDIASNSRPSNVSASGNDTQKIPTGTTYPGITNVIESSNFPANQRKIRQAGECYVPREMRTGKISCRNTATSRVCAQFCDYGYTFQEGIKRKIKCLFEENKWTPNGFEECQPFVNCKLTLASAGSWNCFKPSPLGAPNCTMICHHFEKMPYVARDFYTCDVEGNWKPPLPYCIKPSTDLALAQVPDIKLHEDDYEQYLYKPM